MIPTSAIHTTKKSIIPRGCLVPSLHIDRFIRYLIGTKLPEALMYIAFALGPILGICGAFVTDHRLIGKISLILTTLCLLPIQFDIISMVLFAATGLEGTQ
jgi:hypothetical protein